MTQQHTPLPWQVRGHSNQFSIWGESSTNPARAVSLEIATSIHNEANAAYIVQACNSYEELLAAAQQLDRNMGSPATAGWGRLRAAIAKGISPQAR